MPENDAVIEFVVDENYIREFHDEWVATCGRGWRIDRIMILAFGVVAIAVAVGAYVASRHYYLYLAGGLLLVAVFEGWKHLRRRSAWVNYCKALPWYGRTMRLVLRGSELLSQNDYDGDRRFQRTGEVLATPNGYLVRYKASERIDVPSRAISSIYASMYVPHRAIIPAMSSVEFTKRISSSR